MKIIDCFMYFDEDMMLDIRLNILNKFVSHFVICDNFFTGISSDINFYFYWTWNSNRYDFAIFYCW